MKNKKILILGSSRFLGSHLIKSLYKGNEVIQFDIESPTPLKNGLRETIKFIQEELSNQS